jgi:hypothetical protein
LASCRAGTADVEPGRAKVGKPCKLAALRVGAAAACRARVCEGDTWVDGCGRVGHGWKVESSDEWARLLDFWSRRGTGGMMQ